MNNCQANFYLLVREFTMTLVLVSFSANVELLNLIIGFNEEKKHTFAWPSPWMCRHSECSTRLFPRSYSNYLNLEIWHYKILQIGYIFFFFFVFYIDRQNIREIASFCLRPFGFDLHSRWTLIQSRSLSTMKHTVANLSAEANNAVHSHEHLS